MKQLTQLNGYLQEFQNFVMLNMYNPLKQNIFNSGSSHFILTTSSEEEKYESKEEKKSETKKRIQESVTELQQKLLFFDFCLRICNATIRKEDIHKIWNEFVLREADPIKQAFLEFFQNAIDCECVLRTHFTLRNILASNGEMITDPPKFDSQSLVHQFNKESFSEGVIRYIIKALLPTLSFKQMIQSEFNVWKDYFTWVNVKDGHFHFRTIGESCYILYDTKVDGLSSLWEIIFQAQNSNVSQMAQSLLKNIHTHLDPTVNVLQLYENFVAVCMNHANHAKAMSLSSQDLSGTFSQTTSDDNNNSNGNNSSNNRNNNNNSNDECDSFSSSLIPKSNRIKLYCTTNEEAKTIIQRCFQCLNMAICNVRFNIYFIYLFIFFIVCYKYDVVHDVYVV
ncbi:protein kinase, Atypical group [Reticulomyxa filosa]|uniref:Protein kinase, Atypical group n=1 Tax=Reticulomyxa filosa TaxID=46433 RepID=X6PEA2_RETFI|nr:protein kinase, Atypical group [Reticulomyxa filosa]|eukprot:ETO36418.1 protein kinase, Atypical group [Reticulomyxa filosa]